MMRIVQPHVHTGSLDWKYCYLCNPELDQPEPTHYIYDCKKCSKQFVSKIKLEEEICSNCKEIK